MNKRSRIGRSALLAVAGLATCLAPALSAHAGAPIKVSFYLNAGGAQNGVDDQAVLQAVEAKFYKDTGINMQLTIVQSTEDQQVTKVQTLIAAKQLDFVSLAWGHQTTLLNEPGIFAPLSSSDLQQMPALMKWIPQSLWKTTQLNGQTVGIPIPAPVRIWIIPWIRVDLLKKYHLPMPHTISQLSTVLYAFKQHGVQIPVSSDSYSWLQEIFEGYMIPPDQLAPNGDLLPHIGTAYFESPQYKSYLELFHKWYADGIIDHNIFGNTTQLLTQNEIAGKVGVAMTGAWLTSQFQSMKGQQWAPLVLTLDNGQPTAGGYANQPNSFDAIISSSPYKQQILKFLNWMDSSIQNTLLVNQGIEGKDWKYNKAGKIVPILLPNNNGRYSGVLSDWDVGTAFQQQIQALQAAPTPPAMTLVETTYPDYAPIDGWVPYTFSDPQVQVEAHNLGTYMSQTEQKMIIGALPVDQTLQSLPSTLQGMGFNDYMSVVNKEFKQYTGK